MLGSFVVVGLGGVVCTGIVAISTGLVVVVVVVVGFVVVFVVVGS